MKINQVDLNLFYVFDAVMKHRSVARAAADLSLSPSAVSHALARLRLVLEDELFVRGDSGLQPTQRAMELAGHVSEGLLKFESALSAEVFVPAESRRRFRLAASDYFGAYALPHLVQRFAEIAPQVDLQLLAINRTDVARQLEMRSIDIVIGWFETLPGFLRRAAFVRESGAVVVRAGHPLATGSPTREQLLEYPHIVLDLTGPGSERGDGFVDDRGMVRRTRMERGLLEAREQHALPVRVAVTVPYFTAVPPILRVSDYVASLPRRFARRAVAEGGLVMLDPALEPGAVDIELVWHKRDDGDAGLRWLVSELVLAGATASEALA